MDRPAAATKTRGGRQGRRLGGIVALVGLALGLLLVRQAVEAGWPLPGCPFLRATGHPCAFCGTTRSFAALGGGEFQAAIRSNPLAVLGVAVAAAWALARLAGLAPMRRLPCGPDATRLLRRLAWGAACLLALLNWIWLVVSSR